MEQRLTNKDKEKLALEFPDLNCDIADQRIWGTLYFYYYHHNNSQEIIFDTNSPDAISDNYEIEIRLNERGKFGFPKVFETSNRLIKNADHHFYPDESCCVGICFNHQWVSAYNFIYQRVIPFFYWQSYFLQNGMQAWKGYSHNSLGLLEALLEIHNAKGSARNKLCPCGSGIKYKKCCAEILARNPNFLAKINDIIKHAPPNMVRRLIEKQISQF